MLDYERVKKVIGEINAEYQRHAIYFINIEYLEYCTFLKQQGIKKTKKQISNEVIDRCLAWIIEGEKISDKDIKFADFVGTKPAYLFFSRLKANRGV